MRRLWALPFLLIALAIPAAAQVQVSGTVTDPHGLLYSNATIQAQLVPTGITPTVNGQAVAAFSSASLDQNGFFSMTLADNNVLSPGGTQWQFTVSEIGVPIPWGTGPQQFVVTLTITGSTMDVSGTFSAVAPALTHNFGGTGGCSGGAFTPPGFVYGSAPTVCSSSAFLYYPTGATGSAGACAALGIPTDYTHQGTRDGCYTANGLIGDDFGANTVFQITPSTLATGALSAGSLVCPFGKLSQTGIFDLCATFSSTNYEWTGGLSAANTFSLGQVGGSGAVSFDNTGAGFFPGGCFITIGNPCGALSGLTTDGILYATSATGATSTNPPSTNNGQYNCGYTVTANAAVPPSCYQIGLSARAVTGTTDTVQYTDNNQTVEYQGASAVAVALPTPTTLQNSAFFTRLDNLTTGTATAVTVTPATWTINGAATLVIPQNQSCRINVNPNVMNDWLAVCEQTQHIPLACPDGLGDFVNAITAATYPIFSCVNRTGITWTVKSIVCYTDNAGTTTLDVKNNAGTSFLTGPVTCNNTKSGGGAAGTLSGTTTLANNDAFNLSIVADGTSKGVTLAVSFLQ